MPFVVPTVDGIVSHWPAMLRTRGIGLVPRRSMNALDAKHSLASLDPCITFQLDFDRSHAHNANARLSGWKGAD